jgi:metal-responsive CopG/Arc/MetJ family transcriptional regulator
MIRMSTIKTTINIDEELWRKFSIRVIQKEGCRKKNDVIEDLIKAYVERKR